VHRSLRRVLPGVLACATALIPAMYLNQPEPTAAPAAPAALTSASAATVDEIPPPSNREKVLSPSLGAKSQGGIRTQEVAAAIEAAAQRLEPNGFAGTVLSGDRLTLHWKGTVPAEITQLIEQFPAAVEVAPAPLSLSEYDQAARDILDDPPARLRNRIVSAGPAADFTSLLIGLDRAPRDREHLPRATADGIPLTYTVRGEIEPVNRWHDTAPYWGGGALRRPSGEGYQYCTSAVKVQRNSDGRQGMLTAHHCGTNTAWSTAGGGAAYGTSDSGSAARDAAVIYGRTYAPAVYYGPPNSNNGVLVTKALNPGVNLDVRTEGSFSGYGNLPQNTTYVTEINQYAVINGITRGPGFWTRDLWGFKSVGQGDSGGPVIWPSATGEVYAMGIISGVQATGQGDDCQGVTFPSRRCGSVGFHTNVTSALSTLGLSIASQ
jgi:streptogrisin D